MISFTQDKSRPDWEGYMYAVLLLLVAILQSLLLQQYFHLCFVLGVQVRTAIMTAVYKKVNTGVTAQLLFFLFFKQKKIYSTASFLCMKQIATCRFHHPPQATCYLYE